MVDGRTGAMGRPTGGGLALGRINPEEMMLLAQDELDRFRQSAGDVVAYGLSLNVRPQGIGPVKLGK